MKFRKISAFNLTVLVGISLFWEAFSTFRILISLMSSLELVSLRVFKISECFFEWIICVIRLILWNIRNFKLINCFWEQIIKNSAQFILVWGCFIPLCQIYFIAFWEFVRKEWNDSFPKRSVISKFPGV